MSRLDRADETGQIVQNVVQGSRKQMGPPGVLSAPTHQGQQVVTCHLAIVHHRSHRPSHSQGAGFSHKREHCKRGQLPLPMATRPTRVSGRSPAKPSILKSHPLRAPPGQRMVLRLILPGTRCPTRNMQLWVIRRGHDVGLGLLCTSLGRVPSCWTRPSTGSSSGY